MLMQHHARASSGRKLGYTPYTNLSMRHCSSRGALAGSSCTMPGTTSMGAACFSVRSDVGGTDERTRTRQATALARADSAFVACCDMLTDV
jgi:hypothetical protein